MKVSKCSSAKLKPSMFELYKGCTPKLIVVKGMPLLKRYRKMGELIDDKGKKRCARVYSGHIVSSVVDWKDKGEEDCLVVQYSVLQSSTEYEGG